MIQSRHIKSMNKISLLKKMKRKLTSPTLKVISLKIFFNQNYSTHVVLNGVSHKCQTIWKRKAGKVEDEYLKYASMLVIEDLE